MKPWGQLEWLISKTPRTAVRRVLIGCVGAEERSTAIPRALCAGGAVAAHLFVVHDPPSRFTARIVAKTSQHVQSLVGHAIDGVSPLSEHQLFASDDDIASILASSADASPTELWIDITAMPKRFFFLLVKLALRAEWVTSLFVTYAQPAPGRYTPEHLSEDPDMPQPLPGFGPVAATSDRLVVSIGFEPLGLAQVLGEYRDKKRDVIFLVPFPPGQPYSRRVWETIRSVGFPGEHKVRRVPALDAFGTVRTLSAVVPNSATGGVALAPYGPKPMSLGMCAYAALFDAPVYYTQPRVYHPDYTLGAGSLWAYCLKLSDRITILPPNSGHPETLHELPS
jgi:hypothetical protein